MNRTFLRTAVAAIALATASMASAQHTGHTMPMPAAKKPVAKKPVAKKQVAKKPVAKKPNAERPVAKKPAAAKPSAKPAVIAPPPVDHGAMGHSPPPSAPIAATPPAAPPVDDGAMGHDVSPPAVAFDHAAMGHDAMRGALGSYPMEREASGTAWQPDSSDHSGLMREAGDWTLMAHGNLDLIADAQGGRRGDDKLFVAGMLMGMAKRDFANGNALQFRAMVSPDPLMGKSGYPLLLASGETADGETRLVDRQHPHDFFMELSASYSVKLGANSSAFVYGGLPGEPAFGPPAFMHRQSISTSPEAPITHHWLDSTHITFGVVTAGLVLDRFKLEASRFNGREPDEKRWNIETGPLDSSSVRLSWNSTRELSLQGSWAHLEEPEQLEPGIDQKRWSASAIYTRPIANGWWSSTAAWGRKTLEGHSYDAFALENSLKWNHWTLFGRGEVTENNELVEDVEHGPAYRVGKASLGLARDVDIGGPLTLVVGALASINFVPQALEADYGKTPLGAMGFIRVKLD